MIKKQNQQQREFKSARNKKSLIKVHAENNYNPNNFFV